MKVLNLNSMITIIVVHEKLLWTDTGYLIYL